MTTAEHAIELAPVIAESGPARESLRVRVMRYVRTLIVGSWATIADFSVLTLCTRVLATDPIIGRIPALLAGALVQFFGSRSYAFRAQSGSLSRQAKLFVLQEVIGLPLTLLVFRLLIALIPFLPAELVGMFANTVVFVIYSYPVRRFIVFQVAQSA
ncbi:MAG TPA: GtrA family protein [Polyangiaceae bacterium]|nr:GtrA family protein [Polyangiaceae bacterium]